MRLILKRAAIAIAAFVVLLVGLPVAALSLWVLKGIVWDNPRFAADFFDGLLPYERVLASRKWHPLGGEPWDCTFAAVELPRDTPHAPGFRGTGAMGWQFRWGGYGAPEWQPTPAPPLGDTTRDAVEACARDLPPDVVARIRTALAGEGAVYWRDRVGESLHLFAPDQRLALALRYGD